MKLKKIILNKVACKIDNIIDITHYETKLVEGGCLIRCQYLETSFSGPPSNYKDYNFGSIPRAQCDAKRADLAAHMGVLYCNVLAY